MKEITINVYVSTNSKGTPLKAPKDIQKAIDVANEIWAECGIKIKVRIIAGAYNPTLPRKVKIQGKGGKKERTAVAEDFPHMDKKDWNVLIIKEAIGKEEADPKKADGKCFRLKGFCDSDTRTIFVESYGIKILGQILAHEVGHALGLEHTETDGKRNLMRKSARGSNKKLTEDQCKKANKSKFLQ